MNEGVHAVVVIVAKDGLQPQQIHVRKLLECVYLLQRENRHG